MNCVSRKIAQNVYELQIVKFIQLNFQDTQHACVIICPPYFPVTWKVKWFLTCYIMCCSKIPATLVLLLICAFSFTLFMFIFITYIVLLIWKQTWLLILQHFLQGSRSKLFYLGVKEKNINSTSKFSLLIVGALPPELRLFSVSTNSWPIAAFSNCFFLFFFSSFLIYHLLIQEQT